MASIYKRGKTWTYEVSYYENGKKHKTTKGGFKRQTDAKNAAIEIESKKNKIGLSTDDNISFSDYFLDWVKTYKLGKVSIGVEKRYLKLASDIKQYFGNKPIKEIKRQDYQKFIDGVGKNHVRHTVIRTNGSIRKAVIDAIDDGIIYKNFTNRVVLTGSTEKQNEHNYLDEEDIIKLKNYCVENQSMMYITLSEILFALLTGCRYGEVAGLTWDCIDFKNKTVDINKTYDYINRTGFKPTKTKSSVRQISINDDLIHMLKKIKVQQNEHFLKNGFKNTEQLVFLSNRNQVPTSNGVNKTLSKVLKELEIDNQITFHGLRHTHASYLISKDVSIDYISERLGHADTSITSKIYIHLLKDKREEENNKTIQLLNNI
ncbi:tyrosine-type recombinase/integrase [Lactobacillus terrae]|uniref:tyrosine-type recombinase/integrase n=1 Tax=Lactobacillus terrae TaxID=2269374 RepID=UPI000C1B66C7|nr:tyrosine-type recombinase/integrase [Lactobacillus terrae]